MTRREKLQAMLVDDPQDVFLHYGLANEFAKEGQVADAVARFEHIHRAFPDYVPAWFRHAQVLADDGQLDQARRIGEQAAAVAERVGDHHAAGELRGFLELLP